MNADYPDPAIQGAQSQVSETTETAGVVAALLGVMNTGMLLASAVGLITGVSLGLLIGRRTAPPPPPRWRSAIPARFVS